MLRRFLRFTTLSISLASVIPGTLLLSSCSHTHKEGEDGSDEDEAVTKDETPETVDDTKISGSRTQSEIEADAEARRTFPLVYNEFVQLWIDYFTSPRGRPVMEKWLTRSTRYIPLMQQVLREQGLPEDLIYLSMIESGFNLKARSRAKAVGPWQFITGTGQRYGLDVTYWLDERSDVRKSTFAAAKYLSELHQIFGSWYLAAASYNAGEGRVLLAVQADRSRNFWELARKKKNFRSETRNYVPKIIAAALISKNPVKYGFTDIPYQLPQNWEIAHIPNGVTVKSVAATVGMDEEDLQLMNAELRRGITPPGDQGWDLRVPPEKKDLLMANVGKLEAKKIGNFLEHTIRRGETLSTIARKYGVNQGDLKELNKIRNTKSLRPGHQLLIPIPDRYLVSKNAKKKHRKNHDDETPSTTSTKDDDTAKTTTIPATAPSVDTPAAKVEEKIVAKDDKPAATQAEAPAVNKLAETRAPVGPEKAAATAPDPTPKRESKTSAVSSSAAAGTASTPATGNYTVQSGDSLWSIAKRFNTSVSELKKANGMRRGRNIRAGATLKIPAHGDDG